MRAHRVVVAQHFAEVNLFVVVVVEDHRVEVHVGRQIEQPHSGLVLVAQQLDMHLP